MEKIGYYLYQYRLLVSALLVFFLFRSSCDATRVPDHVPPAPLAEIFFSPYNPSMNERKNRNGEALEAIIKSLSEKYDPLYLLERREELRLDEEARGLCFASIGCWGGDIPHAPRQTMVRNALFKFLENGVNFSELGVHKSPFFSSHELKKGGMKKSSSNSSSNEVNSMTEDSSLYPIHFVLAAGDNFYPKGVSSFNDLAFYTTFESFYASDVIPEFSASSDEENQKVSAKKRENAMLIPWIVALGNHDAIQSSEAEVQYTYRSIEKATQLSVEWLEQINKAILSNSTKRYAEDTSLKQRLTSERGWSPTGRWYMPQNHYAIMVSTDMVVIVIDVPELHRCAIFNRTVDTGHIADEDSELINDKRPLNIKVSKEDCIKSKKQQEDITHWLLEKYDHVLYKIVLGHYPLAGNGPHPNYPFLVNWLQPLLKQSCATVYIHSDNHYLQVSHDGLQYYAGTGAGAGNHGKLHKPGGADNRPFWYHPKSVFQSIQGGFIIHCALHDELKTSGKIKKSAEKISPSESLSTSSNEMSKRFISFVIGESGQRIFSFEADMDGIQRCREDRFAAALRRAKAKTITSKGETKNSQMLLQRILGIILFLFGCRLLYIYAIVRQCFLRGSSKWVKKWWCGVRDRRNPNRNLSDPYQPEGVGIYSPVREGLGSPSSLFVSFPISPTQHYSSQKTSGVFRFPFSFASQERGMRNKFNKVLRRVVGFIFCGVGVFCLVGN